jgi:hypothetical protein
MKKVFMAFAVSGILFSNPSISFGAETEAFNLVDSESELEERFQRLNDQNSNLSEDENNETSSSNQQNDYMGDIYQSHSNEIDDVSIQEGLANDGYPLVFHPQFNSTKANWVGDNDDKEKFRDAYLKELVLNDWLDIPRIDEKLESGSQKQRQKLKAQLQELVLIARTILNEEPEFVKNVIHIGNRWRKEGTNTSYINRPISVYEMARLRIVGVGDHQNDKHDITLTQKFVDSMFELDVNNKENPFLCEMLELTNKSGEASLYACYELDGDEFEQKQLADGLQKEIIDRWQKYMQGDLAKGAELFDMIKEGHPHRQFKRLKRAFLYAATPLAYLAFHVDELEGLVAKNYEDNIEQQSTEQAEPTADLDTIANSQSDPGNPDSLINVLNNIRTESDRESVAAFWNDPELRQLIECSGDPAKFKTVLATQISKREGNAIDNLNRLRGKVDMLPITAESITGTSETPQMDVSTPAFSKLIDFECDPKNKESMIDRFRAYRTYSERNNDYSGYAEGVEELVRKSVNVDEFRNQLISYIQECQLSPQWAIARLRANSDMDIITPVMKELKIDRNAALGVFVDWESNPDNKSLYSRLHPFTKDSSEELNETFSSSGIPLELVRNATNPERFANLLLHLIESSSKPPKELVSSYRDDADLRPDESDYFNHREIAPYLEQVPQNERPAENGDISNTMIKWESDPENHESIIRTFSSYRESFEQDGYDSDLPQDIYALIMASDNQAKFKQELTAYAKKANVSVAWAMGRIRANTDMDIITPIMKDYKVDRDAALGVFVDWEADADNHKSLRSILEHFADDSDTVLRQTFNGSKVPLELVKSADNEESFRDMLRGLIDQVEVTPKTLVSGMRDDSDLRPDDNSYFSHREITPYLEIAPTLAPDETIQESLINELIDDESDGNNPNSIFNIFKSYKSGRVRFSNEGEFYYSLNALVQASDNQKGFKKELISCVLKSKVDTAWAIARVRAMTDMDIITPKMKELNVDRGAAIGVFVDWESNPEFSNTLVSRLKSFASDSDLQLRETFQGSRVPVNLTKSAIDEESFRNTLKSLIEQAELSPKTLVSGYREDSDLKPEDNPYFNHKEIAPYLEIKESAYQGQLHTMNFENAPLHLIIESILNPNKMGYIFPAGNITRKGSIKAKNKSLHEILSQLCRENDLHQLGFSKTLFIGEKGAINATISSLTMDNQSSSSSSNGPLVKLNFEDTNLRLIAQAIAVGAGMKIKGLNQIPECKISCGLRDITWDWALKLVLATQDLSYSIQGKSVIIKKP